MISWNRSGADSFYAYLTDKQYRSDSSIVDRLRSKGAESPTGRARFCFHPKPEAMLHVMMIYHDHRTTVPIHRHYPFGEWIIVQEGSLELLTYNDALVNMESHTLVAGEPVRSFAWVEPSCWHRLVFPVPTIFFEISQGPMNEKVTQVT